MIENYAIDMFTIPLLHLKVKNWNSKKILLLDMMSNGMDYFTQKDSIDLHLSNNKIQSILEEELNLFADHFGFTEYRILISWFATAKRGDYHSVHSHSSIGYSSVCYVDYDINHHKSTEFIAPFNNFLTGNNLFYIPEVEEGSIIFFPSSILHYANPNQSEKERSILAFNLDVKN